MVNKVIKFFLLFFGLLFITHNAEEAELKISKAESHIVLVFPKSSWSKEPWVSFSYRMYDNATPPACS